MSAALDRDEKWLSIVVGLIMCIARKEEAPESLQLCRETLIRVMVDCPAYPEWVRDHVASAMARVGLRGERLKTQMRCSCGGI